MRALATILAILYLIAAAGAITIGGGTVSCSSTNGTDLNPPRVCNIHLSTTNNTQQNNYAKECQNSEILSFLEQCGRPGDVVLLEQTVFLDRQLSADCWEQQCNVTNDYLTCAKSVLTDANKVDFQAAANLLLADCGARGLEVGPVLGQLGNSAGALPCSSSLIAGAVMVAVAQIIALIVHL